MSLRRYILDEKGNPVVEPDLMTWARWFENAKRSVGLDQIGPYKVSTVFLGLDHNYSHIGPPVLWETMVFKCLPYDSSVTNDPLDQQQTRCSGSREQAEAMHQNMVKRISLTYHEHTRNKTKARKSPRP